MQFRKNALASSIAVALTSHYASGAVYTVTVGADSGAGSLRDAVSAASAGDVIVIDSGVTVELESAIEVEGKDLIITSDIAEGGATITVANPAVAHRLLELHNDPGSPDDASALTQIILSGLNLTGADSEAPGGAVYAENILLTLHRSSVTGNTGRGAGGGILLRRGELCLQGADISGNTVEAAPFGTDYHFALGGGVAVEGAFRSGVARRSNCATRSIGNPDYSPFDLVYAQVAAYFPSDYDQKSTIQNNNVTVATSRPGAVAMGGGLFALDVNSSQKRPEASPQEKYSSDFSSNHIVESTNISGNAISVTSESSGQDFTQAHGAGAAFASIGGTQVNLYLSSVSGNAIDVMRNNANGGMFYGQTLATGGGISLISERLDENENVPSLLRATAGFLANPQYGLEVLATTVGGGAEDSFVTPACGSLSNIKYSRVSGNEITIAAENSSFSTEGPNGTYFGLHGTNISALGAGMASIELSDRVSGYYGAQPVIPGSGYDCQFGGGGAISSISSIDANQLSVSGVGTRPSGPGENPHLSVYGSTIGGGGLAVGAVQKIRFAPAPNSPGVSPLLDGKYVNFLSGNSGNAVVVSGLDTLAVSTIGGGGVLAGANATQLLDKPSFDIPDAPSGAKYVEGIVSSPGGIQGNSVTVSDQALTQDSVIAGGGVLVTNWNSLVYDSDDNPEGSKYAQAAHFLLAGSLADNSVSVDHLDTPIRFEFPTFTDPTFTVYAGGLARTIVSGGGSAVGTVPSIISGFAQSGDALRSAFAAYGGAVSRNSVSVTGLAPMNTRPLFVETPPSAATDVVVGGGGVSVGELSEDFSDPLPEGVLTSSSVVLGYSSFTYNSVAATISGPTEQYSEPPSVFGGAIMALGGRNSTAEACEVQGGGGYSCDKYDLTIRASTIAGNTLSTDAGANASVSIGAGVMHNSRFGGDIRGTTFARNLALQDAAGAGQFAFNSAYIPTLLQGSLVSGDTPQGRDGTDFQWKNEEGPDLYGLVPQFSSARFPVDIGGPPSEDQFLNASLADPAFLGPVTQSPSAIGQAIGYGGSGPVGYLLYYGVAPSLGVVPLLQGSGAIDPSDGGACLSGPHTERDNRFGVRDQCPDLGAFEFGADSDGDGVPIAEESGAPATDPTQNGGSPFSTNGDGNSDGVADEIQPRVASLSVNNGWLTLDARGLRDSCNNENSQLINVSTAQLPAGAVVTTVDGESLKTVAGVAFTIDCDRDATTTVHQLELIAPKFGAPSSMKLIKERCDNGDWETLASDPEEFGSDRVVFSFSLTEGGPFDCDNDSTTLTDPAFVAVPADEVPIPTLQAWILATLSGLIGWLGITRLAWRRTPRKVAPPS